MTRVIIYSGKGGTGKTTISAATAALLAQSGRRTLVLSSDPAHSLADALGVAVSRDRPTTIAPGLYALEVDTIYEWRHNLGGFQQFVASTYSSRGIDRSTAAELANQPGLDEILALQRVMSEAQSGRWDAIVLDTAPTGNTLRLLAYPEMIIGGDAGKKFFRVYRGLANFARPFKRDLPDDRFFDEVGGLLERMEQLANFLLSPDISLRLVLNPEKLPLLETRRAYTFLNLYGMMVDAVMVNKILPQREDLGPYFDYWVSLQRDYLEDIEHSFAPTPIFRTVLQGGEPIGLPALSSVGQSTFGLADPGAMLFDERPIWLEQWNDEGQPGQYDLCLKLPFMDEEQTMDLTRSGPDLTLTVGRIQRTIALPRILYNCTMGDHRYEDNVLRLEFREGVELNDDDSQVNATDEFRVEAA
ncbi:ArsA family ATPase [Candidatus Viridilinea mediisalina]|uniref:arsenite-transporting ATPase n=1 Tax=Candidatus Viridilinea mediisalina TaxID=2024553 RepID=A0A2A6RMH0_9CHLR|nr:ArsA family ATPase [Candidatus Viridilinea mediisalina]PDW04116.1 arsenic-transporting ATPase [Candidatus Viridilinea mediisalina]